MAGMLDFDGFGGAAAIDVTDDGLRVMVSVWNKRRSARPREIPTVRDFTVPPSLRIAQAVASAAVVRDVAAFGAVVLFGTMVALVLGGGPA